MLLVDFPLMLSVDWVRCLSVHVLCLLLIESGVSMYMYYAGIFMLTKSLVMGKLLEEYYC